jgi:CDP-diacylglycerol--serine O-phosphatidyltransferase
MQPYLEIKDKLRPPADLSAARPLKRIAILPTLLTLGNGVCGFAAIAYASRMGLVDTPPEDNVRYLALSGWLIVAAMIFDSLDGYIARLARSTSKFGGELDSLCDAISFGAAPALLLLKMGPGWDRQLWHEALAVIATLYMVCAVLRLARYNVRSMIESGGSKKFEGLPSPAAAGCVASLALLRGSVTEESWHGLHASTVLSAVETWAMFGALLVALLMVSQVPYPHLTKQLLRGKRHFNHVILLVLAVFVMVFLRELALVLLFWGYVAVVLLQFSWDKLHHHEPPDASLPDVDRLQPPSAT